MGKDARHVSGYIVDGTRALDVPRVCRFAEATDVWDDEVVVILSMNHIEESYILKDD